MNIRSMWLGRRAPGVGSRAAALVAAAGLLAADLYALPPTTGYAGSTACKRCHPSEFAGHALSAHASALFRAAEHPLFDSFPVDRKLIRKPDYLFAFSRSKGELRVRINDRADIMDLPLEWAFGAGGQAVTFVTRVDKSLYVEHYASYYSSLRSYGATPGQAVVQPRSLPEAAGVICKIADPQTAIAGCFECHSTGPVSFSPEGGAELIESGVRCEACHGAGAAHAKEPSRNRSSNPGKLPAAALNGLCGKCHRPPAARGVTIDWSYAWNVRHQPVYLSESRCFQRSLQKSRDALACLTCHDAHEPAGRKKISDYNARCVSCTRRPINRRRRYAWSSKRRTASTAICRWFPLSRRFASPITGSESTGAARSSSRSAEPDHFRRDGGEATRRRCAANARSIRRFISLNSPVSTT